MAAMRDNMTCAVCTEVYTSPRFLPCHHTFCLPCLEELAKRHGNIIPCPTCRAPATVPPGGVSDLQVNFYFTEDVLEQARSEESYSMCPVHAKQVVILHCTQCKQVICLLCKLTKHDGHITEELSETAARYKKMIKEKFHYLVDSIKLLKTKLKSCEQNEKRAQEKRTAVMEQIQVRHDVIVAMAGKYRDTALQELQKISDDLEKKLAADTQRVQDKLNSLLRLQDRAQRALSSCDTEVLQVEKEMTEGEGIAEWLKELKAGLHDTNYRPGLHGDFTNDIEDCIRRYIGSPVKLEFPSEDILDIIRVGRCGDEEGREVISLRQKEDKVIEAYYGGPGGDVTKVERAVFDSNGYITMREKYEKRLSCVTRKNNAFFWENPGKRLFGSKSESIHAIDQNCSTGYCQIVSMGFKQDKENEMCVGGTISIKPNVYIVHNFDSTKQGVFFALVDEEKTFNNESEIREKRNEKSKLGSRVVRLFSNKSNDPIATYTSPIQPFFPTDVCFYGEDMLLIADWMNDCVHMAKVTNTDLRFISYLPGSGDFVRPTALNLDLQDQLLIGCGDGWILKCSVDI